MARPDPAADRAASIADEQRAAYKRINEALKTLSERANVSYEAIPTAAKNAPDLLQLQQSQHIAKTLETLAAAPAAYAGRVDWAESASETPQASEHGTSWNEGQSASFSDSTSTSPRGKKGV